MNQKTINEFISCLKMLNNSNRTIQLPDKGDSLRLKSKSRHHYFIIDVNLKGRLGNITLQLRSEMYPHKPLLRLDIAGRSHPNPEGNFEGAGQIIPCPHMHIAHPDYGDSIAYPLNSDMVKIHLTKEELNDLVFILRKFLIYMNTGNISDFDFHQQMNLI